MMIEDIWAWAWQHHYMAVNISPNERISGGRDGWSRYLLNISEERYVRLVETVKQIDARVQKEKGA